MKMMALLLVVCSAHICLAQGIPCPKMDEAELKGMDRETLAMTFCDYKSRSDANRDAIRSFDDFSFMDDAWACMDEMLKVERVYRDRFGGVPPECGN